MEIHPQSGETWVLAFSAEDDLDYYLDREMYDRLIGIPLIIDACYTNKQDEIWVNADTDPTQGILYPFKAKWLTQVHKEPTILPCVCYDIWAGCTCGAFKKEMEAKGKVYSPIYRMYLPKAGISKS